MVEGDVRWFKSNLRTGSPQESGTLPIEGDVEGDGTWKGTLHYKYYYFRRRGIEDKTGESGADERTTFPKT